MNRLTFYSRKQLKSVTPFCTDLIYFVRYYVLTNIVIFAINVAFLEHDKFKLYPGYCKKI